MIYFLGVVTGVLFFLMGFILGAVINTPYTIKKRKTTVTEENQLERLKKEYQNFLSYDGSEQA